MIRNEAIRRQYLNAMGVCVWERRPPRVSPAAKAAATKTEEVSTEHSDKIPSEVEGLDWTALQQRVSECTLCTLHATRTQTVFGIGDQNADWLFIGEAPGADEDRQGEPFVGRAGKLLSTMLFAIGLKREMVYIANVLKCRPPKNRDPQTAEVVSCEPYLLRQIELIAPRVIVALGRHAAHSLLKTELPLGRLRGQRLQYHHIPLVATYHPAYLLRNPADKAKVWQDLCLARQIVEVS